MGGSGRGSGLEAEQAGDGSPSEPTVLKEVELPEPLGEAMVGAARAAEVGEQVVRASQTHSLTAPMATHTQLAVPTGLRSTTLFVSSLILYLSGFLPSSPGLKPLYCCCSPLPSTTPIIVNLSN